MKVPLTPALGEEALSVTVDENAGDSKTYPDASMQPLLRLHTEGGFCSNSGGRDTNFDLLREILPISMNDETHRCAWSRTDPLMRAYHDTEWGVPIRDARALWELLMLEGFQAGLSWITILRKRENFRKAFANFDPAVVARFGPEDTERLMQDAGIVRARSKIDATISGARIFLSMQESGEDLAAFAWRLTGGKPIALTGPMPVSSPLSERMSKELKRLGFNFVGPIITYSWMQASGMLNDHAPDCFRREAVGSGG